jgi:hypothetical protein
MMTLEDVIRVALASPPGSITFAKRTESDDALTFEIESVNGEKPAEA